MSILKKKAYTLLFEHIVTEIKNMSQRDIWMPLQRSDFVAELRKSERELTQLYEECPEIFQL